jgi:hypothetical protein
MKDRNESLRRFEEAAMALARRKARLDFLTRTLAEMEAEEARRAEARQSQPGQSLRGAPPGGEQPGPSVGS